ncbi:MAG TPA: hypothetical protein VF041_06110 [Gemmatimonadaceae bacterium]
MADPTARARGAGWRWTLLAAAAGLATSGVFSGVLHWARAAFVGAWLIVAALVLGWYVLASGIDPAVQLRRRWAAGVIVGVLTGVLLAFTVSRQPASPTPGGAALLRAELWSGFVYGAVDALMLSVLPVLSLYGTRAADDLARPGRRLQWAATAMLGSLLVAAAYHLGFREYRGAALVQPLVGNGVVTLAYLLAGNPLAPIIAHVTMHVAAVLHGAATTTQLPPHY